MPLLAIPQSTSGHPSFINGTKRRWLQWKTTFLKTQKSAFTCEWGTFRNYTCPWLLSWFCLLREFRQFENHLGVVLSQRETSYLSHGLLEKFFPSHDHLRWHKWGWLGDCPPVIYESWWEGSGLLKSRRRQGWQCPPFSTVTPSAFSKHV